MALMNRAAKPAPEALYEVAVSFAVDNRVYQAGQTLRGDHEAVRTHFGQWMLASLPDDEKRKIRSDKLWGQTNAEGPSEAPKAAPIAEPATGPFRAVRNWTLADPDFQDRSRINAGEIVDASDPVFRRYPHLFVKHTEAR